MPDMSTGKSQPRFDSAGAIKYGVPSVRGTGEHSFKSHRDCNYQRFAWNCSTLWWPQASVCLKGVCQTCEVLASARLMGFQKKMSAIDCMYLRVIRNIIEFKTSYDMLFLNLIPMSFQISSIVTYPCEIWRMHPRLLGQCDKLSHRKRALSRRTDPFGKFYLILVTKINPLHSASKMSALFLEPYSLAH